jgi:hypothetical protein
MDSWSTNAPLPRDSRGEDIFQDALPWSKLCGRGGTGIHSGLPCRRPREGIVGSSPTVRTTKAIGKRSKSKDAHRIFCGDKQRALAVSSIGDEGSTNLHRNDLRNLQGSLPAFRETSQWPSLLPMCISTKNNSSSLSKLPRSRNSIVSADFRPYPLS